MHVLYTEAIYMLCELLMQCFEMANNMNTGGQTLLSYYLNNGSL